MTPSTYRLARSRTLPILLAAAAALTFAPCRVAFADDDVEAEQVATYAVQRRLFRVGLELNGGVGFLPMNAFTKGFVGEGSVTYHFSNVWAWEIIQGGYVFANVKTGLRKELLENFGVEPTQLPSNSYLASSNIVLTPFYGKLSGLNRSLNHVELFFPFGVALARYENPATFRQGADLGLGLRWFLGTHTSFRFEVRDYLTFPSFSNFSLTNEVLIALGFSFAFGGDER